MRTSSTFRLLRGRFALGLLVVATTLVTARAVTFPDSRLEAAVRDALNQPSGEITAADMLTLTELDAAGRGIKDTSGLETALNLQALHFSGNPATNYTGVAGLVNLTLLEWGDGQIRDTTFLAGLQALTRLYFNSNPVTNFSGIAGLSNLTQLTFDFGAISDLTFLTDLTKLRSLEIYQNQIQDISPLSALRDLQTLQLDWNSVTNLNVLSGLTNLLNLSLAGNGVTNIDFVAPLQHLQSLGLYIDHVSDLSPLAGRTNLLALGVGWNKVTNPAVIATLTGLQSLGLNGNDLTNVPYLAGLTNLTSLSLDYTLLEDMSPVTNLTRLNDLNVGENSLTRLPDLSSLTNLKAFMMAGNQITDLWPLTNLAGVDQLHLQRNLFQDLSPLAYVPGLRNLLLSGNALTNLSPLQALTNLCSLEMETMQLSDLGFLAPLAGLRELDLSDNQVVGLSALTNLPWLYWLRVDHNRLQEINPLLDCQSLREVKLQANLLDTNAISAAWNIITNLQARGVTVEFDPQYPLSVLPAISVQPRTQSAFTNTAVTFNVLATSTAPKLYYRWQKNGLDLADGGSFAGTDTDTLHASGITAAEGGLYRVRVWTDFGITNSLAAELRIITNVFFPDPSLEQAVRDALAIPSDPLTPADLVGLSSLDASSYGITNLAGIEALADLAGLNLSGNPAIASFQSLSYLAALNDLTVNKCGLENLGWLSALPTLNQVGFADNFVDDLSPLRAIGSLMNVYASGNQLTDITPLLDLSALAYVDVARNRLDTNATSAAWAVITNLQARSVTVEYDPQYGAPVRPEIVEQPVDVVAYLGADVSFSVIASGGGPGFNYQWQKNGINQLNDSHVSGTRTDTLNISGVTAADAGAYRVRIWNDLGVTNSRSARLRVISSVAFVDPNLERAVRESLGIPSGPITLDDLKSLTVLIAHGFGITNLAGLDAAISLTYLNLAANPGITDFTLLADLPALRQVFLDECIVPDLTFASALPWLWEFTARGGGVSDLSPLAGCPKLEILDLGGNPALTNLAALNALTNLDSLSLDSGSLSNISFVASMPVLRYLNLWGNAVQDLSPLTNCIYLDQFEGGYNQITNAALLAVCTNLGGLSLPRNQFEDIGFAASLPKLWFLNLESNPVHDLSPLTGLTNLTWLGVGGTLVADLSPIASLTGVTELHISNLGISNNWSFLAPLLNLSVLYAGMNHIAALPPYSQFNQLRYLNLEQNPLANMGFVSGMTNLTELVINNTGIQDLSPLTGRTNIQNLAMAGNGIADVTPLATLSHLQWMTLWDNHLQNITPLSGLTNLNYLDVRMNLLNISAGSPAMLVIETLQGRGAGLDYDPQKPVPAPSVLSAPTWLGGDQFQFSITSDPGSVLEVLSSADLLSWAHLGYVTNNTGTASFTDSAATGGQKFYRLRLQ